MQCGESSTNDSKVWPKLWSMMVPPKVQHFAWRLAVCILPVRKNLSARLNLDNTHCGWCNAYGEDESHVFGSCGTAQSMWSAAQIVPPFLSREAGNWTLRMHDICMLQGKNHDWLGERIVMILWSLWTARNKVIFENKQMPPTLILSNAVNL